MWLVTFVEMLASPVLGVVILTELVLPVLVGEAVVAGVVFALDLRWLVKSYFGVYGGKVGA